MKTALFLTLFSFAPAHAQVINELVCNGSSVEIGMVKVSYDAKNSYGVLSYSEGIRSPGIIFSTTFTPDGDDPSVGTWTGVLGTEVGILTVHSKKSEPLEFMGSYTRIDAGKVETFAVDCEIPD